MLSYSPIPFGIPLPLAADNLFKVSKRNWLLGLVTIPEGIMAFHGVAVLETEAKKVLEILQNMDSSISLVCSEAPKHYEFYRDGVQIDENWREFDVALALLPVAVGPSLWSFCAFFDAHEELWSDPELLELLELIRDSNIKIFNQVCEFYSFPNFCLR